MPCGACQQRRYPRHLADENRVPSLQQLRIREYPPERTPQAREKWGVVDLPGFMPLEIPVTPQPPGQRRRLATGMSGPARQHFVEIDVDHDAAEIEQQRVGGAGREGR